MVLWKKVWDRPSSRSRLVEYYFVVRDWHKPYKWFNRLGTRGLDRFGIHILIMDAETMEGFDLEQFEQIWPKERI